MCTSLSKPCKRRAHLPWPLPPPSRCRPQGACCSAPATKAEGPVAHKPSYQHGYGAPIDGYKPAAKPAGAPVQGIPAGGYHGGGAPAQPYMMGPAHSAPAGYYAHPPPPAGYPLHMGPAPSAPVHGGYYGPPPPAYYGPAGYGPPPPGAYAPQPYGGRYGRPGGIGAGGAAMMGAGAGFLGGLLIADAMTPDCAPGDSGCMDMGGDMGGF
ncbi:hypothetical protein ABPG75_013795 [Micractinium tetrahymenae]